MRGKDTRYSADEIAERITPAYAGKSQKSYIFCGFSKDHPRICGEKVTNERKSMQERGSPPHMRGKVISSIRCSAADRITPAYAGKSNLQKKYKEGDMDHPRICGEKFIPAATRVPSIGSPPHMRGKAAGDRQERGRHRITPAYAGKRCGSSWK